MSKENWTDEQRKEFGAKMKAAREAKKAQPQTATAVAEPEATQASTAAGIEIPPTPATIRKPTVIPQLSDTELQAELDDLTLEEFLDKHHKAMDANYDKLAKVAHLDGPQEVRDILKGLGYDFPPGA